MEQPEPGIVTVEIITAAATDSAPVHRFVRRPPSVQPSDWGDEESFASAGVWWPGGGGAGIGVPRHEPLAERVAFLADQFQESEVEALWFAGRSAVWPHCPRHPNTHPLQARVLDGIAVWVCGEATVIAAIGALFDS